jgi:thymidine kinase
MSSYKGVINEYNTDYGFLHLIIGPMFSGKSTRLINILNDLI